MRSQVASQPYVGGYPINQPQFGGSYISSPAWQHQQDVGGNRRVVGSTMSSPGPTPPVNSQNSAAVRSAPPSPAPNRVHLIHPKLVPSHNLRFTINPAISNVHNPTPEQFQDSGRPLQGYENHQNQPHIPRVSSADRMPRDDVDSYSYPPSLPPRRNPPPPPPRSGSGLRQPQQCSSGPTRPSIARSASNGQIMRPMISPPQPLSSTSSCQQISYQESPYASPQVRNKAPTMGPQPTSAHNHSFMPHTPHTLNRYRYAAPTTTHDMRMPDPSSSIDEPQFRSCGSSPNVHHESSVKSSLSSSPSDGIASRTNPKHPPPTPSRNETAPPLTVKCADPEATDALLRLLFARFVGNNNHSGAVEDKSSHRPSVAELRQVIGHLVRIAHTDVIMPAPFVGLRATQSNDSTAAEGLVEKMDTSIHASSSSAIQKKTALQRSRHYITSPCRKRTDSSGTNSSSELSEEDEDDEVEEEDEEEQYKEGEQRGLCQGVPQGNNPAHVAYQTKPTSNSGCFPDTDIPILTAVELHALPQNITVRNLKASAMQALVDLVSAYQTDPGLRQRDLGITQLLAHIQSYTAGLSERLSKVWEARRCGTVGGELDSPDDGRRVAATHTPVPEVAALVRLSFHAEHRQAICDLGGLHALLSLLRWEHSAWQEQGCGTALPYTQAVHSTTPPSEEHSPQAIASFDAHLEEASSKDGVVEEIVRTGMEASLALRRYICMALTNLTFGVAANKAFVCKRRFHLEALLAQLEVGSEELKQVAASVLRNLSWRTDAKSKAALRKVQAASRLTVAVLSARRDPTLRTTLSALWNLSSHCISNKKAVCSVDGALGFLVSALDVSSPSKGLPIMESSGGILRNLCSVIVTSLEYRAVLRSHNYCAILLEQLRTSPSLTVVVNVCGILGTLSALPPCDVKLGGALLLESAATDHALMIRSGALEILHRLAHSRHRFVVTSSKIALENLERAHMLVNQRLAKSAASYDHSAYLQASSGPQTTFSVSATTTASPTSSSSQSSSPGTISPTSPAELVYRRRMSNRSHLRFGLLSVVLETDDDFEEEDEDDKEEDESSAGEEEDVPVKPALQAAGGCGEAEEEDPEQEHQDKFKLPDFPIEKVVTCDLQEEVEENEEEQACVYADEGTPFGPSARASVLDLRSTSDDPSASAPLYDNFMPIPKPVQRGNENPYVNVAGANCFDGPNIYAMEGTPSHASHSPDEDIPPIPAHKVFMSKYLSPTVVSSPNALETPMMFSRATSSCISSLDLGMLPPIESSPESVYSDCAASGGVEGDGDDIALGTSPSELPIELKSVRTQNEEKEDETRIMFAEEGSPLDGNSLSGDQQIWRKEEEEEENEGQSKILQQCIASVMPTRDPPKLVVGPRCYGNQFVTIEDTLQSFALEGTPFVFSTKTSSFSDVSITDPDPQTTSSNLSKSPGSTSSSKPSEQLKQPVSDASSVNEEGSCDLLSEVIQSALPKQSAASILDVQQQDTMQHFAFEGTPSRIDHSSEFEDEEERMELPKALSSSVSSVGSGAPPPPMRTTSVLGCNQGQHQQSSTSMRPKATVAPMPQRSSEVATTKSVDSVKESDMITRKSTATADTGSTGDASSFSSLLSIESAGVETSLLQECISSAMPTPKLFPNTVSAGPLQQHHQHPHGVYVSDKEDSNYLPIASVPVASLHSSSPSPVDEMTFSEIERAVTTTSQNPSASSIRRAGHFLAHGSGAANDTMKTPINQRPDACNHQPAQLEAIAGVTHHPLAPRPSTSGFIASPTSITKPSSCSTNTPTAILKPFPTSESIPSDNLVLPPPAGLDEGEDGDEEEEDNFPLPPAPLYDYDESDDADVITLIGDSSPPHRPPSNLLEPKLDSKCGSGAENCDEEDYDDGLLDLENLDDVVDELTNKEEQAPFSSPPSGLNPLQVSTISSQSVSSTSSESSTPKLSMLQRPSNLRRPFIPARSASAQSSTLHSPINVLSDVKSPPNGFLSYPQSINGSGSSTPLSCASSVPPASRLGSSLLRQPGARSSSIGLVKPTNLQRTVSATGLRSLPSRGSVSSSRLQHATSTLSVLPSGGLRSKTTINSPAATTFAKKSVLGMKASVTKTVVPSKPLPGSNRPLGIRSAGALKMGGSNEPIGEDADAVKAIRGGKKSQLSRKLGTTTSTSVPSSSANRPASAVSPGIKSRPIVSVRPHSSVTPKTPQQIATGIAKPPGQQSSLRSQNLIAKPSIVRSPLPGGKLVEPASFKPTPTSISRPAHSMLNKPVEIHPTAQSALRKPVESIQKSTTVSGLSKPQSAMPKPSNIRSLAVKIPETHLIAPVKPAEPVETKQNDTQPNSGLSLKFSGLKPLGLTPPSRLGKPDLSRLRGSQTEQNLQSSHTPSCTNRIQPPTTATKNFSKLDSQQQWIVRRELTN